MSLHKVRQESKQEMTKIREIVGSYTEQNYGGIPCLLSIKCINTLNGNESWFEVGQDA